MKKGIVVFYLISCWLAVSISPARTQEDLLRLYFIDVNQGESTLIISPTGKTMLVDGGEPGDGSAYIVPLFHQLGITKLDVMVATHYHSDHYGGLSEVAAVFPPTVAYDSGNLTAPTSSPIFMRYVQALGAARQTMTPGTVIDLGGGAQATCIVVNGQLVSGGRVVITGRRDQFDQLDNSASIGLLVQSGDFDYFVSGDLSGGGINTTDVESTVAPLVGDVDVLQINHHGSRTSSNRTFLNALKAEVGIVQLSGADGVDIPTIEVIDRFINTVPTSGIAPSPPDGNFPALRPPVVYQNQPSPSGAPSVVSNQGIIAEGTFVIQTDGHSYDVSGGRLTPRSFPTDGAEAGIRTDFPPSIVLNLSDIVPAAGQPITIGALVSDDSRVIDSVAMSYSVNEGEETPLDVQKNSSTVYSAIIPGQADGMLIRYRVTARDGAGQASEAAGGCFVGVTPIQALRVNDSLGVPRYLRFPARIAGAVTVGSGTFSSSNNDVYVQDATGGVDVFELRGQTTPVTPGDQVTVTGRLMLFNGVLELEVTNPNTSAPFSSPFGIVKTGSGAVPAPIVKTLAEINESAEGLLVRIDQVTVRGSIPSSGSGNLTITDGTGQVTLRILSTTGIPGMPAPSASVSIMGIVGQFDGFRPMNRGYQILPRSRADFIPAQ
jgi:beta-lactamase superfamily II metal-dependent hydrolase